MRNVPVGRLLLNYARKSRTRSNIAIVSTSRGAITETINAKLLGLIFFLKQKNFFNISPAYFNVRSIFQVQLI